MIPPDWQASAREPKPHRTFWRLKTLVWATILVLWAGILLAISIAYDRLVDPDPTPIELEASQMGYWLLAAIALGCAAICIPIFWCLQQRRF